MAKKRLVLMLVLATASWSACNGILILAAEPFGKGQKQQGSIEPQRSRSVFEARLEDLLRLTSSPTVDSTVLNRLRLEIDQLGAARYSFLSGLYWHTDIALAKAESRQTGKPILVLRLMGDLREEFSCANSRFFRTVLYCDPKIAKVLGRDYVLYWQTVRSVPKITIEFEDGRKIHGTITGNSIHYILSSDGLLLDAFPGLYEPAKFLSHLKQTKELSTMLAKVDPEHRKNVVKQTRRRRLSSLSAEWGQKLVEASEPIARARGEETEVVREKATAAAASRLSVSKRVMTEQDIMKQLTITLDSLDQLTDAPAIKAMAETLDCQISKVTRQIIASESYGNNVDPRIEKLNQTLAMDTVLNEYQLRPQLLRWLLEEEEVDLEKFNRKVYAELFLTPDSDPWFGLLSEDRYTALVNDGVRSGRSDR